MDDRTGQHGCHYLLAGLALATLIAFALLLPAAVLAAEIDFSTVLTDGDGEPMPDCVGTDCAGKPPLTLGRVAMRALAATFQDENPSGEEKLRRGELGLRVYKGGVFSLTAEDISLIKRLIAKGYGPLIVARTWPLLDPPSVK